ncbi:DNRLRE domain-containing protein [Streptomyces sp. NBC_00151]|nr:DNRLRE domain-containing protein [Streptomyces sp. NBC_00151]WRZ44412.1 DNRLRE domain-containing protein [Streptomyces sp. NBC_00151]
MHIPPPVPGERVTSRAPGRLPRTTALLALSLTLLSGAVLTTPRPAVAATPAVSGPAGKLSAPDVPSALAEAKRSGKRVEALSERTETSTTWAGQDGSLTTELTAGPVRFDRNGSWVTVDTDLTERRDGTVAAKAHPASLTLAGKGGTPASSLSATRNAGARDLVTLGEGEQQVTLQWKGGLPQPELDGNRATYPDAVPGADVVVEATRTGFEQYVEIKQRPSTKDYGYTLSLRAEGLRAEQQPDSSVLFTDRETGQERAVMPAPVMWDATVDERSGEHTRRVPVAMQVKQRGSSIDLVVTPDSAFLADPTTRYPVTVDPSTSVLGNVFDTYVQQGEARDWSTDTELDFGNPGTKNTDGTPRTARSFITWGTAPLADALVTSAELSLWNFHSGDTDCKPQPWTVWSADKASVSSRWTSQPTLHSQYATSTETKGNPKCGAGGWINADVTSLVQTWASSKAPQAGMGLRAADESVVGQWKRVNSANATSNPPKLTVTYNFRPRSGNNRQAGPPFAKDASDTWQVDTTTPTLRDTFSDKDGDRVTGTFEIVDAATGKRVGDHLVSPRVDSGRAAAVTVADGTLKDGATYRFRTSPYDGTHYNLAWSDWATFTVGTGRRPGNLPDMPQALESGATQSLTPLLSGLVSSPEQGRVRAEFALRDADGKQLSGVSVPETWVDSGRRAAARVPEGALRAGTTYLWAMRACTDRGCSAWSYEQEVIATGAGAPKAPDTTSVTLTGPSLDDATVPVGAKACAEGGCPAVTDGRLTLDAGTGGERAAWLKPDLGRVPEGARVTRARLVLTPAECGTGTCAQRPVEMYQLHEPWAAPRTGTGLLEVLDDAPFTGAAPADTQDLAPLVQSWIDEQAGEGIAVRLPAADAASPVSYHSSRSTDQAKRPQLVITYVAPTAPGAPQDLRVSAGDGGLLATWNPPLDPGSSTDGTEYTALVTKTDGSEVTRATTRDTHIVVDGLKNGTAHRVTVTARTPYGTGPGTASQALTPVAVPGGAATYREIVQQYADARSAILTDKHPTAAAALAASSRGAAFQDLLGAQAADLAEARDVLARRGQRYTAMTTTLSDVLVGVDDNGTVFLRAVLEDSAVLTDGNPADEGDLGDPGGEPEEGRREQRFTFSTNSGAPILHVEADAPAAETVLSASASAADALETTDDSLGPISEVPDEPIALDADGLPIEEPAPAVQKPAPRVKRAAAQVSGSGTLKWASRNVNTRWEYGQDCTNFVSKALYYGGNMKTRQGGRKHDRAWWQQYYLFGSIKNKSYTWAAAENFRRHMIRYRGAKYVTALSAKPGDLVLFKWKKERGYNHVAIVERKRHGLQLIQHGSSNRTSLAAAILRYRGKPNYIERVIILRPKARS